MTKKPAKAFDWLKDKPMSAAALAKIEKAEESARAKAERKRKKLKVRAPEHTATVSGDQASELAREPKADADKETPDA